MFLTRILIPWKSNMSLNHKAHNIDGLYARIRGDKEDFINEDTFRTKVHELVDIGFIETSILDDHTIYTAKHGLKLSAFVQIHDPIKNDILLLLVANPTTNYVFRRVNDEDAWERFILICKPEQSGKTFVMIQQIIKDLDEHAEKKVINFIFCDNSLLLVKQTSERVQSDLESFTINDESYIEFSSRDDGKAQSNSKDIVYKILMDDIRNVVSCTNGKRVTDISSIIKKFNTTPITKGKYEFKIWLDEADKFAKFIDSTFKPLADEHKNVRFYCLTATPDPLFKKYRNMNVLPIENTTSPDYHGWEDNKRVILENISNTVGFIHDVLTNHVVESKISKGSKWFIPGDTKKSSHQLICDILVGKGFAVFVVNGDGIALTLPTEGRPRFREDKTEELNKQMMRMHHENGVDRFPVAITGNICVGRGISIMSPEFIFDYAILSNCAKKAEASQNAGRTKGNIKSWPNYKAPTVYTTAKFDAIATEWEGKSRRLAELAFEKDEVNPSIVTKAEFKGIGDESDSDFEHKVFDEDKAAIEWVLKEFKKKICLSGKQAPNALRPNNGPNPTLEYVINRKWGLASDKKAIRKIRLNDGRICVYWRPSNMINN